MKSTASNLNKKFALVRTYPQLKKLMKDAKVKGYKLCFKNLTHYAFYFAPMNDNTGRVEFRGKSDIDFSLKSGRMLCETMSATLEFR